MFRMGYLLPIQYTQYQEYQNRIKRVKTNEIRTNSVDRVKRIYLLQKNKLAIATTKHKGSENTAEKVYADLTGIGRNFDERI
jgi:Tfp pilus assembly protein PilE